MKHKRLIVTLLIMTIILFTGAYLAGIYYFNTHFMPLSSVNGIMVDNMTADMALEAIQGSMFDYSLEIFGKTQKDGIESLGKIGAADIDMSLDVSLQDVEYILNSQNSALWPVDIIKENVYSWNVVGQAKYSDEKLEEIFKQLIKTKAAKTEKSENAYISEYSDSEKGFIIIPETYGNIIDEGKALNEIKEVLGTAAEIDLEEKDCYIQPEITSQDKELNKNLELANKWIKSEITYDWNANIVVLDGNTIKDWINVETDKNGLSVPKLDEEAVGEFVRENAEKYDTYGKNGSFVTTAGYEITLRRGSYGWKTDCEAETKNLIAMIKNGDKTSCEPIYSSRAAQKGKNDIGTSYVEADMTGQHLFLYKKGELVLETDFVSGNMSNGCTTPTGIFGITYKTTNAVLRGRDYVTPVNYWMPFYGNYGMHDATWREEFGGDIYLTDGSHGCLNLPLDMAEAIYGYMSTGFPVVCYY